MANENITKRFRELDCTESEKQNLYKYLFACLDVGKSFKLRRNRVMILKPEHKNKFIILKVVKTSIENQVAYICPQCFKSSFGEFLSSEIQADKFKSCIHTKLCNLIWGNEYDIEVDIDDDEDEDLVEVITEKPRYMAVIHPSRRSSKGPGVVAISSKMLNPKCVVCKGEDSCIHLRIHLKRYKEQSENGTEVQNKKLKIDRVVPKKPKKINNHSDVLDPFQKDGPASNVFDVKIDFLEQNRKNRNLSFPEKILVANYDANEECEHGNNFEEKENILNIESYTVKIHHSTKVNTDNLIVLFRPTIQKNENSACCCKKKFTGKENNILRVSPSSCLMSSRNKVLHFVSYEFYFEYLARLLTGGETMNSFIKSKKFMEEIYFGFEKSPEYQKILSKGFEIFCHALYFPEDSNYCYECPQPLRNDQNEDDFQDDIEYSIVDGIQMGCRANNKKAAIEEEYFKEEVVEGVEVKGIEAKQRTFINVKKVRTVIGDLVKNIENPVALSDAVNILNKMELDSNSRSILEMLNRISSQHKKLPIGYKTLLRELSLETPISALMLPYSSQRDIYQKLLNYLNNKMNIFSSAEVLERFINDFPIITECIKDILEAENSKERHFLPTDVSSIFKNMIKLRFEFDKLSKKVASPRVKPGPGFVEPLADYFPNYSIHTKENIYKADTKPNPVEDDEDCEKHFNSTSSITGGIGSVTCNHKITKGFRAIRRGESPVMFCHSILRRLPAKVQAHKRVVVYDFACQMHKVCLRRYPYRIRRFQFVIDRHHQGNHTACSQAYNISKYPVMNELNTQIAEQLNNSLRKLSTVVAYSNFQTYLKIIQIFITFKNLRIKKII